MSTINEIFNCAEHINGGRYVNTNTHTYIVIYNLHNRNAVDNITQTGFLTMTCSTILTSIEHCRILL